MYALVVSFGYIIQWSLLFYDQRRSYILWLEICHHKFCHNYRHRHKFFWKCGPFQIFIFWYLKILFCWSALFISFFAAYFLLAYSYAKLFTVFVYGSWIWYFYEYIWKPVYCLSLLRGLPSKIQKSVEFVLKSTVPKTHFARTQTTW